MAENPNNAQQNEAAPPQHDRSTLLPALSWPRLWSWRMLVLAVWVSIYTFLPDPFDTCLLIVTLIPLFIWAWNRASRRMKLPSFPVKFERVETITLTHVLLLLLLLVMVVNHSELVNLKKATVRVEDSVIDLQNSASENKDEINSSLDDLKNAIEASR